MRCASLLALLATIASLGCASPTEGDSDSTDQGYTAASGAPELAPGWATTPAFDGHSNAFSVSPRGALASSGGGLVAFVEDFDAGSLAAQPVAGGAAIPIASEAHYHYGAHLAADADGVLYDRSYYWSGSPVYAGLFFSSRAGAAFDKETVDAKIPWTSVNGVCLASHAGAPIAVYATGAEIRIAERDASGWTPHSVDSSELGSSFRGCVASGDDVFVLVGTGTFDFLRVARFSYAGGAWGAATIEPISNAPKIASATIALAPSGEPRVAWADASSMHLATRTADAWSATSLPTPFDASVTFSIALAGDVVVAGVYRDHPKVAGWSKDAIYVGGAATPFALVYSPTSGSLRVNGAAVVGGRLTVSAVESQYGGDYRFLTATGPL